MKQHDFMASVLGVGSHHGDDVGGWNVVELLSKQPRPGVCYQKIANPIELLDLLASAYHIHLVDAGIHLDRPVRHLNMANAVDRQMMEEQVTFSSHDFGVIQSLRLAESLGHPIDHVHLWLISGRQFQPLSAISHQSQTAALQCARSISEVLSTIEDMPHVDAFVHDFEDPGRKSESSSVDAPVQVMKPARVFESERA